MSRQVIEKVKRNLKEALDLARSRQMLVGGKAHLLLAVSGGLDSMVLLDACSKWSEEFGLELSVAHVDHNLRKASAADAKFVQEQSEQRNIPFYLQQVQPPEKLGNIEAWARGIRYGFFDELLKRVSAHLICTAHHLDDQAETLLMRLCSGRLASSSKCIEFLSQERKIMRPLLELSRDCLSSYAQLEEVEFVEDESNFSEEFLRNKVRHQVTPILKEVFSDTLPEVLVQTLKRLSDDETALELIANDESVRHLLPEWRQLQLVAKQQLEQDYHCIGYADYQRIIECRKNTSSRERVVELGQELVCRVSPEGNLFFERKDILALENTSSFVQFEQFPQSINIPGLDSELSAKEVDLEYVKEYLSSASSKSANNPLEQTFVLLPKSLPLASLGFGMRFRKEGDRVELRMGKQRSLKKLLQDKSIPLEKRWSLPLVVLGDDVLWIPGVERFTLGALPQLADIEPSLGESMRIIELRFLS